MLQFYFDWKPYQGANSLTAKHIFVGEDANFEGAIETQPMMCSCWVLRVLLDTSVVWQD